MSIVVFCGTVCYSAGFSQLLISWIKPRKCVISSIKAIEQYFPVVLFIMLYKVVLQYF